jgi:predicted deacylase
MEDVITINGKRIYPGESAEVSMSNLSFPTRTIIDVPVFVFRSLHAGPKVLFQAGMHGEEVNGVEVVRSLLKREDIQNPRCGTIVLIPIVNVVSFLMNARDLPDGRDLNRCFPGSKNGSMGSRLAYDLMKNIISQIDFGVDFHTGGAKINNYPQIRCVFEDERNIELSNAFSAPFVLNAPYRDKSLRKEAAKKGKHILVFEGGESQRFNSFSINEGINGCLRMLHCLGMIDTQVEKNQSIILKDTTWIRAKSSGMFRTNKKFGSFVEKDSVIGKIVSPYAEKETFLFTPSDGFVIGINNQPIVNEGDALMNIGVE